ncbi:MAG: hypothetical protein ABIA76_00365 [Candidatus Diapherotrites archaeon]
MIHPLISFSIDSFIFLASNPNLINLVWPLIPFPEKQCFYALLGMYLCGLNEF